MKLDRSIAAREEAIEIAAEERHDLLNLIEHMEAELTTGSDGRGGANSLHADSLACRQQRDYILQGLRGHLNGRREGPLSPKLHRLAQLME